MDKSAPSKWASEKARKFYPCVGPACEAGECSGCEKRHELALEFDAIARERDEVAEKLAEATDLQAALRKACEEAVEVCIYSLDDTAYANEYQIRKFTDIIERHLTPVFEALRDSVIEP